MNKVLDHARCLQDGCSPAPHGGMTTTPATSSTESEAKYRHQFIQTQKVVEIAVLAKSLTQERVKVEIQEGRLRVIIFDTDGKQVALGSNYILH